MLRLCVWDSQDTDTGPLPRETCVHLNEQRDLCSCFGGCNIIKVAILSKVSIDSM